MSLAEFIRVDGYKITDTFKHLDQGYVLVALAPEGETETTMHCHRCGCKPGMIDFSPSLRI
jgi:hypothetical protein